MEEAEKGLRILMTAKELADATGLPLQRIWFAGRTGLLPSVRLGRRMFFGRAAVDEWIAQGGAREGAR